MVGRIIFSIKQRKVSFSAPNLLEIGRRKDPHLSGYNIKSKIEIIKRFDLRTENSIEFYVCASKQPYLTKDDKKCETEFKCVPVYANNWLLVYEGLKRDQSVYTIKVLDIKNRRIIAILNNSENIRAVSSKGGKSRNIGIGYLYYLGQDFKDVVFARSDYSVFSIQVAKRKLNSYDEKSIRDPEVNEFEQLREIFKLNQVKNIRKLDCRIFQGENKKWITLENFNYHTNTGVVDVYSVSKNSQTGKMQRVLLLRITYNNNDRAIRELKHYKMTSKYLLKLSDTYDFKNMSYLTSLTSFNLETKEIHKFSNRIVRDKDKCSGITSIKVDWRRQFHVLFVNPKKQRSNSAEEMNADPDFERARRKKSYLGENEIELIKHGHNSKLYEFFINFHRKQEVKRFFLDFGGLKIQNDSVFDLHGELFLIWISEFGVIRFNWVTNKMQKYPDLAKDKLGNMFGKMRSMEALPCFYDEDRMIREGEYQVEGVTYKKIVFYDIMTGEIDEVFNSIPKKKITYNNRDFLYAQFNKNIITIYDMVTRSESQFIIDQDIASQCLLLRIDRASKMPDCKNKDVYGVTPEGTPLKDSKLGKFINGDNMDEQDCAFIISENKINRKEPELMEDEKSKQVSRQESKTESKCSEGGSYYISIYNKETNVIHNYHIKESIITSKWIYTDWIPNIKRVTFRGPTGYVILSTISVYDMDKRIIITADKRKVFDSLLNCQEEYKSLAELRLGPCATDQDDGLLKNASFYGKQPNEESRVSEMDIDLEFMRLIYYRMLQLSEPFAYILKRWLKVQCVYDAFHTKEIPELGGFTRRQNNKGVIDKNFFGLFEGVALCPEELVEENIPNEK